MLFRACPQDQLIIQNHGAIVEPPGSGQNSRPGLACLKPGAGLRPGIEPGPRGSRGQVHHAMPTGFQGVADPLKCKKWGNRQTASMSVVDCPMGSTRSACPATVAYSPVTRLSSWKVRQRCAVAQVFSGRRCSSRDGADTQHCALIPPVGSTVMLVASPGCHC